MHFSRLGQGELVAALGSLMLAGCLFLAWYETDADNRNAVIDGARGAVTGWEVHGISRWLLLLAAAAPLILVWIVVRDHELSWPRGEMTAVAAVAAFGIVAYIGFLDRPGTPSGAISLSYGYFGALGGTLMILAGGALSAGQTERVRKPPGIM